MPHKGTLKICSSLFSRKQKILHNVHNNLEWFQTGRCSCALSQLLSQLASWPALGSAQFVTCAGELIVFSFLHWWGFSIHQVMWLSRSDYIINDVFFPLGVQADTLNPVHVCKAAALSLSQSSLSYLGKVLQNPPSLSHRARISVFH